MAEFAVAIYKGKVDPGPLDKPEAFQLWREFCQTASWRFSPWELLEIELRLRTGRAWQCPDGAFTLAILAEGTPASQWVQQMLAAIVESRDATKH